MWDQLILHFETLDKRPGERMAILVGGLLLFWLVEAAIPLFQNNYRKSKIRHAGVNLGFTAMHLLIHTLLAVFIVLLSDWCRAYGFGLVYWTGANTIATILIVFITLDLFGGWLVHWSQHQLKFLWRFHLVHHADNNVDVTTGLRHHPMESLLRGFYFFAGILISGAPMYAVMIYQTLLVMFTAFTHANISLHPGLDRMISYVLVSPNMHKVHHHWVQPYTDSNYGAVLSIWDRLFGTFRKLDPGQIRYGLDRHYPNDKDEHFFMLLKKPFGKLD